MSTNILYDLTTEPAGDKALLEKAAASLVPEGGTMQLRPLGRFGNTSAKLFAIRVVLDGGASTISHVAKLDTAKNIRREKRNTAAVASFFENSVVTVFSCITNTRGVLVFRNGGDKELKSVLDSCIPTAFGKFRKRGPKKGALKHSLKIMGKALNDLPLPTASGAPKPRQINVRRAFKTYLRGEIGIDNLERYTKRFDIIPGVERVAWNTLFKRILLFLDSKIEVLMGPVHGDLHPSNIMVDKDDTVTLIDFAWAKPDGVSAIDYAMMENSIHYMWSPFWLHEGFWKRIDDYMLCHLEIDEAAKNDFLNGLPDDPSLREWGDAVWDAMVVVRKAAKRIGVTRRELLATRSALLLGQAKFQDYSPPRVGAQLWRLLEASSP